MVLLCEHGAEGSFGLILNRPLDIQLSEAVEGFYAYDDTLSLGGPVQRDTLHFVHRCGEALPDAIALSDGVRWGGDFETLRTLLQQGEIDGTDVRFFVGYAGWSPGQLDDEIDQDGWILTESDAEAVFPDDASKLWRSVLRRMGGEYAILANFPDDPRMN